MLALNDQLLFVWVRWQDAATHKSIEM